MPTFSTTFTPPSVPGGLLIEADIDLSAVHLTWDASDVAQVDFAGFRVYRSADNGVTWALIAQYPLVTDTEHFDYGAPLNTPLVYRLTQSNNDFESDPVEGSIDLPSDRWQIVVPGDASLTFAIPKLRSAGLTSPKIQDMFSPIGRPGKVAVGDVVQAEDGEIAFLVMPDNLAMVNLMKAVQAKMAGSLTLKATDGSVWQVQFGDLKRSFTNWGGQELSIPFSGVG